MIPVVITLGQPCPICGLRHRERTAAERCAQRVRSAFSPKNSRTSLTKARGLERTARQHLLVARDEAERELATGWLRQAIERVVMWELVLEMGLGNAPTSSAPPDVDARVNAALAQVQRDRVRLGLDAQAETASPTSGVDAQSPP